MHYFYTEIQVNGISAGISDAEQLHHLRDVLRLKTGEQITVCDTAGNEYLCTIASLDKKQAGLTIESRKTAPPPGTRLTVACAVPKLTHMDDIIDKLTQLGVDMIIPMQTERVIVRLGGPGELSDKRLERWRKIGRSAAEQSRRRRLPIITPVTGLSAVLTQAQEYGLRLIPTLEGQRKSLNEIAAAPSSPGIIVLIGPEGDFTPGEVEQAVRAGFTAVSLGETVLRVDTAAMAVASYLKLALSEKPGEKQDKT
jgi:16S rRNA (uracil1498-N3)-methyltransferase